MIVEQTPLEISQFLSCHIKCLKEQSERRIQYIRGLTLPVEFLTDPFTPLLAHLPEPARIANVSTLQRDLKAEEESGREKKLLASDRSAVNLLHSEVP